ncbi:hypothetical protein AKJ56_01765 [candidate division MSBL1 archaeon SCGC-AAA382N08]|uniref:Uncharacterized protein n=1 Tax=candidate division MSBL1 archaeon SCGC-AAA382N08 TaxID=1698285 RepID=A0A133VNX7_9EURY|nr:hypothetical protein AKJ56_01765 [candidate division MSBL1 archaeon SCGC-AAA382N08]
MFPKVGLLTRAVHDKYSDNPRHIPAKCPGYYDEEDKAVFIKTQTEQGVNCWAGHDPVDVIFHEFMHHILNEEYGKDVSLAYDDIYKDFFFENP